LLILTAYIEAYCVVAGADGPTEVLGLMLGVPVRCRAVGRPSFSGSSRFVAVVPVASPRPLGFGKIVPSPPATRRRWSSNSCHTASLHSVGRTPARGHRARAGRCLRVAVARSPGSNYFFA